MNQKWNRILMVAILMVASVFCWAVYAQKKQSANPLLANSTIAFAQAAQQPPRPTVVATADGRVGAGLNPPYLNSLPSAETVKKLIQSGDPTDTLARQVAVFNILKERIQRHIATDKSRPFRATPDEGKVTYAYSYAAWELEEGYKKTHTKEEATAFTQAHYRYESTWDINKEIDSKLLSASAVAEDRANVHTMYEQRKEQNDAIIRQNERYKAQAAAAAADPRGRMVMSNDPTSVTLRRCLELGGNQLDCVGKGFSKGLFAIFGVDNEVLFGSKAQRTGLAVSGIYQSTGGISLGFSEDEVDINGCGQLRTAGGGYTVTPRGKEYVIQVLSKPRPFLVAMGADGNMVGPGPTDVEGLVQVGERHYTVTTRRVSDWQVVGSHDETEPVYGTKTERCKIGPALRSTGPAVAGGMVNLFTAMSAAMGNTSAQDAVKTYPAGVRMLGAYADPGGLKITFALEGAVLDCREAHVGRQYIVQNDGSSVHVVIDNAGTPITLTIRPDASLVGNGTVDVAGRLMTGMAGTEVTFRPVRASCPVGTLKEVK
jgi:hypothetical protein